MEAAALAAEGQVWPPEAREQLMQALSARLRNRVRATDQVMQVGDHGFAVLLLAAGAAEAAIVEQRLRHLLAGPYGVDCG
jgi:GGDEF domain-containing protein